MVLIRMIGSHLRNKPLKFQVNRFSGFQEIDIARPENVTFITKKRKFVFLLLL